MPHDAGWDIDAPFFIDIEGVEQDIDRLAHVNNAVYLRYMERPAWAHAQALGLDWQTYVDLDTAYHAVHSSATPSAVTATIAA